MSMCFQNPCATTLKLGSSRCGQIQAILYHDQPEKAGATQRQAQHPKANDYPACNKNNAGRFWSVISSLLERGNMRREAWTAGGVTKTLRCRPLLAGSVVALLLAGAFCTAVGTAVGLANFRDVGYPDSATLLRVEQIIRSGRIYADGDRPPYYVTFYGPLTYVILAVPCRLAQAAGINPQGMVRLAVVSAVCLCVVFIFLISRRLCGSRSMAWLCALFA